MDAGERLGLLTKQPAALQTPITTESVPIEQLPSLEQLTQTDSLTQGPVPTITISPASALWESAQPYVLAPGRYLQEKVNSEYLRNLGNRMVGWEGLSPEQQQLALSLGVYGLGAVSLGALYRYRNSIGNAVRRARETMFGYQNLNKKEK